MAGLVLGAAGTAGATPPKCKRVCCEATCAIDMTCTWGTPAIVTSCSEFPQWCDDACPGAVTDDDEVAASGVEPALPAVAGALACTGDDTELAAPRWPEDLVASWLAALGR